MSLPRNCDGEVFPGATRAEIMEVMMIDLVGDYETPDQVPEWAWVEKNASFAHAQNGQPGGVWEFVVNLNRQLDDIPEKLEACIKAARANHFAYILFHQGT